MKDIGNIFKEKREEIGVKLEEAASDLDITVAQLENLEDGNINAFKDKDIAKKMYENDVKTNYHPQNSSYKDMGIYEAGHMALNEILRKKYINQNALATDWNNNITAQEIVNEAFENLKINDIMQKRKSLREISTHAVKYNANETIAEAFVDYYTNKNNARTLSKEIINVMKGMI